MVSGACRVVLAQRKREVCMREERKGGSRKREREREGEYKASDGFGGERRASIALFFRRRCSETTPTLSVQSNTSAVCVFLVCVRDPPIVSRPILPGASLCCMRAGLRFRAGRFTTLLRTVRYSQASLHEEDRTLWHPLYIRQ